MTFPERTAGPTDRPTRRISRDWIRHSGPLPESRYPERCCSYIAGVWTRNKILKISAINPSINLQPNISSQSISRPEYCFIKFIFYFSIFSSHKQQFFHININEVICFIILSNYILAKIIYSHNCKSVFINDFLFMTFITGT